MQRFGDDFFAHVRTVGIRRIDEVDAQFDGAAQNANTLRAIGRLAPDSVSRDSHRTVSQARDSQIVPDQEFAGLRGKSVRSVFR